MTQRVIGASLALQFADVDEKGNVGQVQQTQPTPITGQQFADWVWPKEIRMLERQVLTQSNTPPAEPEPVDRAQRRATDRKPKKAKPA